MKLTILKRILLPVALLALAGLPAMASVACSTITTLAQAQVANGSGGCNIGDLVFNNFNQYLGGGNDNDDTSDEPQVPPSSAIGVAITDNAGVFSVVFGFASSNVVAYSQSLTMNMDYTVTVQDPSSSYINNINGMGSAGTLSLDGAEDATVNINKYTCNGGSFGTDLSNDPALTCSQNGGLPSGAPFSGGWQISPGADTDNDSTASDNQSMQTSNNSANLNLTSVGILDTVSLDGGTFDDPNDPGGAMADVNSATNLFTEGSLGSSTPEPGTFILFGGALIALGAIRRKRVA